MVSFADFTPAVGTFVFPVIGSWSVIFPLLYLQPFSSDSDPFSVWFLFGSSLSLEYLGHGSVFCQMEISVCAHTHAWSRDVVDRKEGRSLVIFVIFLVCHLFLCWWQSWNFTPRGFTLLIPTSSVPVKWLTVSLSLFSTSVLCSGYVAKTRIRVPLPRVSLRACVCFMNTNFAFNKSPEQ